MSAQERSSQKSPWLLVATVAFVVAAILSTLDGNYWFALSHAGFAATTGSLYAGAEERGGIFAVLLYAFLGIAVVSILVPAVW